MKSEKNTLKNQEHKILAVDDEIGRVEVKSSFGAGSTFEIYLPIDPLE